MSNTIIEERLSRFLAEAHLRKGSGRGANGHIDVCIVQATDWLTGGDGKTDSPECVDRVIRRFAINLNDAEVYAAFRDELKPYAAKIANTNEGDALAIKRGFMCADWALREVAPIAMDALAEIAPKKQRKQIVKWGAAFRTILPVVDPASAEAAYEIADKIREEAYVVQRDASAVFAWSVKYTAAAAAGASAASAAYAASTASDAYTASDAAAAAAAAAASAAYAASTASDAYTASDAAVAAAVAAAAAAAAAAYAAAADAPGKAKALTRRMWDMSLTHLDALCAATL